MIKKKRQFPTLCFPTLQSIDVLTHFPGKIFESLKMKDSTHMRLKKIIEVHFGFEKIDCELLDIS